MSTHASQWKYNTKILKEHQHKCTRQRYVIIIIIIFFFLLLIIITVMVYCNAIITVCLEVKSSVFGLKVEVGMIIFFPVKFINTGACELFQSN